jgi:hypothetical protein
MPIPPFSVGEDKQTNVESLSMARGGQVQRCDRSRMGRNERIELLSD